MKVSPTSSDVEPQPQKKSWYNREWYKQISVEPTMFLYMFDFMITNVVEHKFFVYKACLINNEYSEDICDKLDDYPEIKKQVKVSGNFD